MPQSIDCGESVDSCIKLSTICTIKIGRVESETSLQINKSTMEINNHADTTVLGSNGLPIHDLERLVDVFGWYVSVVSVECPTISGGHSI